MILRSRGMGYAEIVRECETRLEDLIETDPDTGARVVNSASLHAIRENADDPDHVADPLAQALYRFVVNRNAKIVLPDS
jgi:hypothetical protein